MIKNTAQLHVIQFRKCIEEDLDAIMNLQTTVYQAIKNKDIFVPTERKYNEQYLIAPNFIIGCFDGAKLVAYCSIVLPGDALNNLGWDLLWSREKVLASALLDTIVVHPAYRGHHLQQRLIRYTLALIEENREIKYILTTVSPDNSFSLKNVLEMGFEIQMKKLKYGGKERFILSRRL